MNHKSKNAPSLPARPHTAAVWAAATALGAVAGVATNAEANLVFVNQTMTFVASGDTWHLEGIAGPTSLAGFNEYFASSAAIFAPTSQVFNGFRFADTGAETIRNLPMGAVVNAAMFTGTGDGQSLTFYTGGAGANAGRDWAQFTIGTSGFTGFQFNTGSGIRFGWASYTVLPGAGGLRLNSWAYETTVGAPVTVGAVPEPSTTGLLGLGALAAGIVGMRNYKKQRAVSAVA